MASNYSPYYVYQPYASPQRSRSLNDMNEFYHFGQAPVYMQPVQAGPMVMMPVPVPVPVQYGYSPVPAPNIMYNQVKRGYPYRAGPLSGPMGAPMGAPLGPLGANAPSTSTPTGTSNASPTPSPTSNGPARYRGRHHRSVSSPALIDNSTKSLMNRGYAASTSSSRESSIDSDSLKLPSTSSATSMHSANSSTQEEDYQPKYKRADFERQVELQKVSKLKPFQNSGPQVITPQQHAARLQSVKRVLSKPPPSIASPPDGTPQASPQASPLHTPNKPSIETIRLVQKFADTSPQPQTIERAASPPIAPPPIATSKIQSFDDLASPTESNNSIPTTTSTPLKPKKTLGMKLKNVFSSRSKRDINKDSDQMSIRSTQSNLSTRSSFSIRSTASIRSFFSSRKQRADSAPAILTPPPPAYQSSLQRHHAPKAPQAPNAPNAPKAPQAPPTNLSAGDISPRVLTETDITQVVCTLPRTNSTTSNKTRSPLDHVPNPLEVDGDTVPPKECPKLTSAMRQSNRTKSASVAFASQILIYRTFSPEEYDRKPDWMTSDIIREPGVAQLLREELNEIKSTMLVHPLSRQNTQFFFAKQQQAN